MKDSNQKFWWRWSQVLELLLIEVKVNWQFINNICYIYRKWSYTNYELWVLCQQTCDDEQKRHNSSCWHFLYTNYQICSLDMSFSFNLTRSHGTVYALRFVNHETSIIHALNGYCAERVSGVQFAAFWGFFSKYMYLTRNGLCLTGMLLIIHSLFWMKTVYAV